MNRLENKIAVVTGANSGVGAAIAKLFAAEGATVVMTARREAALEEVSAQIEEAGGKTFVMATDISQPDDPERLMAAVEAVTADRSLHTRDLGGEASTAQVTEAVCRHLQAGEVAARKAA